MIIEGVDSGAFIRALLALSAAYMDRVIMWNRDFMPRVHRGVDFAMESKFRGSYDFIVIGSGYAGCLVASRLASTGCYKVLLIEAGDMPHFETSIPFLQPIDYKTLNWRYRSVPQRYAARGMKDREVILMAGKGLGGTSLLESGIYLPENPEDFTRWERQYKLTDWTKERTAPFFFSVTSDDDAAASAPPPPTPIESDHLRNITAEQVEDAVKSEAKDHLRQGNPLSFLWVQAGMAMGHPITNGISSKLYKDGGFFVPNIMSHNGVRMNAASQFLKNMHQNLDILTGAEVKRIDIQGHSKTARKIELKDFATNRTYDIYATREIILSAGTIGSAKLLLQSGIGPSDHLDELNIQTVQHLPVGTVLRDRVSANLFIKMRDLFTDSLRAKLTDMDQVVDYMLNGTGFLASSSMFGAAVLKMNNPYDPDILLEMKPIGLLGVEEMFDAYNYNVDTLQRIDPAMEVFKNGGLQVTMTVLNPFSVGTMWLRPRLNDSEHQPITNPSYLQDDRDLSALVKGAQFVEAMVNTDYMQLMKAELLKPRFDNCPSLDNATTTSITYWRCVLLYMATTGNHLTSTNAILSVVEPNLKVRGVDRLRVVDESVFPEPVTGGLPATIMAVANKGAQNIINDNQAGCLSGKK